ncbi:hypothetical protein LCGC14_1870240 [marine sediment metagenome]|uniref:Uncharacterized protein n=1 Tax=marine sediment metagenome TaxID=412755 RepID=A0A0F9G5A8_9ZZZZ
MFLYDMIEMVMYVNDLSKGIKILKLFETKNTIFYFIRYHPELTPFENIKLNFCESITERR